MLTLWRRGWPIWCVAMILAGTAARLFGQTPSPPRPAPFPGTAGSKGVEPPASSGPAANGPVITAAGPVSGNQAPAGAPVYPSAEFIDSYDAGSGQRYYLYGANASYVDVVSYYKNLFKNGGRELFKTPPTQQWDLGKYQDDTMAYPPSVVVKDYAWNNSAGYLVPNGTSEKRFRTVIQIVLPTTVAK